MQKGGFWPSGLERLFINECMRTRRFKILVVALGLTIAMIPFRSKIKSAAVSAIQILKGRKSVADRVTEYGEIVRNRLTPRFREIGVSYPPRKITFVGLKRERLLEVWVSDGNTKYEHLKTYPILGTSGVLGPKLTEGDGQIPEGLYKIGSLNPNSLYHLALRVDYPNAFDQAKGAEDGRFNLGSDIMIHGKSASIGCLAMGDQAAEDLFVLAAETGIEHITLILSPVDFRLGGGPPNMQKLPGWTPELYTIIRKELSNYTAQVP